MVKKLKLVTLFTLFFLLGTSLQAQTVMTGTAKTDGLQVADPSFENWSQTFDGQPALGGGSTGENTGKGLWYGANVYKDLVGGVYGQVVYQTKEAKSGTYAAKLMDTEVGVEILGIPIKETSPSWVTLGRPWSHLNGTDTNSATAGTDGGIKFTARPDTMAVWIKRVSEGTEHINLVYYSWKGTAQGASYKNKGGGCTSTSHTDEESDIRTQTDPNICGTSGNAVQIGEGTIQTSKTYNTWTQIKVPIKYYTNDIPEKMNIILSASNYPEGRRNDGLVPGNYMIVDDLSLIYSSKVYSINIDGKPLAGFNENKYEYTIELGEDATDASIPNNIECFRSNRKLSGNEISIAHSTKLGEPTIITVEAEDGSSTSTYKLTFVRALSKNSSLNNIFVNGAAVPSFNGAVTDYNVALPYGTTDAPVITVEKGHVAQQVVVNSCNTFPCTATIVVTAENAAYTTTYKINFKEAELTDNTLADILINGKSIPGFNPTTNTYKVEMPLGTTQDPTIEAVSKYPAGKQKIEINNKGLNGTSTVVVTPPSGTARTYRISYEIKESSYSKLNDLKVNGFELNPTFSPETTQYSVSLPVGTSTVPEITWVKGDEYQTVALVNEGVNGTSKVTVKAQDGTQTIYRIKFSVVQSSVNTLKNIFVDGVALVGFSPDVKTYEYNVVPTATSRPVVTWEAGDTYQTVTKNPASEAAAKIEGETKLTVRAQDGSVSTYIINFTQKLSDNSKLADLSVAGYELTPVFSADVLDYACALNRGTTAVPAISYVKGDATQSVRIDENGVNGTAKITVRAQSGTTTVYTIKFSVAVSSDATLKDIKVGGESINDFSASNLSYDITLPSGTTVLPNIEAVKNDDAQRVIINKGSVNGTTSIRVIAEDGTEQTYKLNFSVEKSASAILQDILVDGVSLVGFDPETLNYQYILSSDATKCPTVKAVGYAGQTITITTPQLLGTASIEVKPETGASNIYTIEFTYEKSSNNQLADIQVNGVSVDGFDPANNYYTVVVSEGSPAQPVITYTKGDDTQKVQVVNGGYRFASEINVVAEDGSVNTYKLAILQNVSSNAQLESIMLDGVLLDGFSSDVYSYNVVLPSNATSAPVVAYVKGNDAQQVSMVAPALFGNAIIKVIAEDGVASNTYTITFSKEANSDATLKNILVNGAGIANFDAATTAYTLDYLSGSTLPAISYEKVDATQQVVVNNSGVNGYSITVTAQNGATTTYVISYNVIPSDNALLSDIQFYNANAEEFESIAGFDANIKEYNFTLAWRTKVLPVINAVPATKGQVITINEGGVEGATTIHVLAADGVTEATYTLNFNVEKTSDATLSNIIVDGNDVADFSADILNYTITLPYGITELPAIEYVNAEKDGKEITEQKVVVTDGGLYGVSTIKVTSEDGVNETVYTLNFKVADSGKENVLTQILVAGNNILEEGKFDYTLEIPVGSDLPQLSISKNYTEQEVKIVKLLDSYHIEVISNQAGVENVVYNVNFTYSEVQEKIYISDLTLSNNAKLYPSFDVNVEKYVALVTSENDVNAVLADGLTDEEKAAITQTRVSNRYTVTTPNRTYTVYMHYNSDVIPNNNFDSWGTAKYNSAAKPTSWKVPADAAEKRDQSYIFVTRTYKTGQEVQKNSTSGVVTLSTRNSLSVLGGYFPGVMTLGNMSVNLASANKSTISISGGVPFRNTPDAMVYRYNYANNSDTDSNKNTHIYCTLSDGDTTVKGEHTDSNVANTWKEGVASLKYNGPFSPTTMNIVMNVAHSENPADLSNDIWGAEKINEKVAEMYVDWVKFTYSSNISDIKVNGVSASKSGNTFSVEIDSEYDGEPIVDIIGEVEDQAYDVVWTIHDKYSRSATIRSYAEDASYTDYTLTITRAKSANNNLAALQVVDLPADGETLTIYPVEFNAETTEYTVYLPCTAQTLPDVVVYPQSVYATANITVADSKATITVNAENGDSKDYVVTFVKEKSNIATLKSLVVEGYDIAFDAATLEYTVTLPTGTEILPNVIYTKEIDLQTVTLSKGLTTTIDVTSEDGTETKTYTINFSIESASTSAKLSALSVANGSALEPAFSSDVFEYASTLTEASAALVYAKEFADDDLEIILTDNKATLNVSETNEYVVNFSKVLSNNVLLSNIKVNGADLDGFDPLTTDYEVYVDKNTVCDLEPVIAEEGQTMEITFDEATSTYTIVVTAEDGVTTNAETPYTVKVTVLEDNNAELAAILINGENKIAEFDADLKYTYLVKTEMPKWNSPAIPTVEVIAGADGQTVEVELNGLDEVSYITVTAEDGKTQKVYELTLVEEQSTYAYLNNIFADYVVLEGFEAEKLEYTITVPAGKELPVITIENGDYYQKAIEEQIGNVLTITVYAEAGNTVDYVITFETLYTGNATLAGITLDGEMLDEFAPETTEYNVELPVGTTSLPEIGIINGADAQSTNVVTGGVNGDVIITVTADDGVTTMEYTIHFTVKLSEVDTLLDIQTNGNSIEGFDPNTFEYTLDLPVGTRVWPVITWTTGDEYQTVVAEETLVDDYNKVVTLNVTAQNTAFTNVYTLNLVVEKSAVNTLKDIQLDNISLEGFAEETNDYIVELPIGTEKYPEVTYTQGDEYQVVTPVVEDNKVTINVVAEDGSVRNYKVEFIILHSSNTDLAGIYVDYELIDGFNPAEKEYYYVLPYGTTELPVVTFDLGEQWQVVEPIDNGVNGDYILNVKAEDGTTNAYAIHFSVAKSDNALLSSILVGEEVIPNFDAEVFEYTYYLPYGETTIPAVNYIKALEVQVVTLVEATSINEVTTITVVAEDGKTTNVYTINWVNMQSSNAALEMIYLDGVELEGFSPVDSEYEVVLPYGTTELPEITWTLGDADQVATVDVTNNVAIISVEAQDGTPNEYIIYFTIEKSAENRLKNIFIKGEKLEGFDPETLAYNIVYPYGTQESEIPTIEDITYEVFEEAEQVELLSNDKTLLIRVTAENGDVRTYAIVQSIALNSNTQIEDILINGKSIDGFDPEILEYTYVLPYGSLVVPEDIQYVTSDTTQTVVMAINPLGEPTRIFVTAQDGSEAIYKIHFTVDEFDPSVEPTSDNVCITSTPDGKWKFTTNCANVSVMISTLSGKVMLLTNLELVDVNVSEICSPEANGFIYNAPEGQILVYYFIHMNKRTIKSGKFRTTIND